MERLLGIREAGARGPTVVGIGGLHGNEPAGVRALRSVLNRLDLPGGGLKRGRFVALAGNMAALRAGVRYIDHDLNRAWVNGEPPPPRGTEETTEATERRKLAEALDKVRSQSSGAVYVVDLHTTSGQGPPFVVMGDTAANRAFALALPVPLVLGLGEQVEGTLIEHLDESGWVNLSFEAGSHQDPGSPRRAEAALWILLGAAGLLPPDEPRVATSRALLGRAVEGLPRAVKIVHVHPLVSGAAFQMRPGYRSFQRVRRGEILARERGREIRAPRDGRILMPLYQERGAEGFFVARVVHPGWLRITTAARRILTAPWSGFFRPAPG